MKIQPTNFEGLFLIEPLQHHDNRGYFLERFNREVFARQGLPIQFAQEMESFSYAGVIRGLHFQRKPFEQGKLVSVLHGSIKDVVLDIRKTSPTYGQWVSFNLNLQNQHSLFIPEGFAHGFRAMEDSLVLYKITSPYNRESEGGIIWNDPTLNIDWGISEPILSDKDKKLPSFEEASRLF